MLLELEELPAVTTVLIVVLLQPSVNGPSKVQGHLVPTGERAHYEIDGREDHQHVMTEKESVEKQYKKRCGLCCPHCEV